MWRTVRTPGYRNCRQPWTTPVRTQTVDFQQHSVISHTVTDVSTRKLRKHEKNCITENGGTVPVLTVKAYKENWDIRPLIPNLGTRQRWQSGQLQAPTALPPGKELRYKFNREPGGLHRMSERFVKRLLRPCWDSNPVSSSPYPNH